MDFEWDSAKAAENLRKRKVSFSEAATVLGDTLSITARDPDHSAEEDRYITIGVSTGQRLLMVAHAERGVAFESSARASSLAQRERLMEKKNKAEMADELRPEYNLRELLKDGVRGKYADRYKQGTNLIPLDPDVAAVFANNEEAVNEALRLVIELKKLPVTKRAG